jgi:Tol biopolymer transport system component
MTTSTNLSASDGNTRWDIYLVPTNGGAPSLKSRIGGAGAVGNGDSSYPSLSQDGLELAYSTSSTNLFAGADANGKSDVVLRTEPAATNTPISVVDGTASTLRAEGGWAPRISATGDAIAFQTRESGDTVVALRTVSATATKLVSRRGGAAGAVVGGSPAGVSSDGDVVMFGSGDVDPGQLEEQVWARVMSTQITDRLSRPGADDLAPQAQRASLGDTSADGRFTVFTSRAVGLGGTPDGRTHAYLRDERNGTTVQLDLVGGIGGSPAAVDVDDVRISDDGSRVVFQAYGSGLAPGDESGPSHLYLWQRSSGQLSVASRAPDGTPVAIAPESGVDISGDGSKVAFLSDQNFLPGDANAADDVFVRDLGSGAVQLATIATNGSALTVDAVRPRLDQDGSVVAFTASSSLDPVADTTNDPDAYVRDLAAGRTELASRRDGAGTPAGDSNSYLDSISGDGDRVVFTSFAKDLGDGVTTSAGDVHVRERSTNRTVWVSRTHDGAQNNGVSSNGSISADGRTVVFESTSEKVIPPAAVSGPAVYARQLDAGSTTQVVAPLTIDTMHSYQPALSANGQCVAFAALQTDLVAGGYASPDFQHLYLKALGDQCVLDDPPATPSPTPATPRDATAPVLSSLAASRKVLARTGKRRSTTLSFTVSEPVLVRLEIAKLSAGKRKGKRCLKPSKVKGRAKACVREGAAKLVQTTRVEAGKRSLRFTGAVNGKRLPRGRYRLILTATDAAGNATAKRVTVDVRLS